MTKLTEMQLRVVKGLKEKKEYNTKQLTISMRLHFRNDLEGLSDSELEQIITLALYQDLH